MWFIYTILGVLVLWLVLWLIYGSIREIFRYLEKNVTFGSILRLIVAAMIIWILLYIREKFNIHLGIWFLIFPVAATIYLLSLKDNTKDIK